jgi:hypothetical protein
VCDPFRAGVEEHHDAMGHTLVKLWNVFVETKPMKLIMVGLDNAGKVKGRAVLCAC